MNDEKIHYVPRDVAGEKNRLTNRVAMKDHSINVEGYVGDHCKEQIRPEVPVTQPEERVSCDESIHELRCHRLVNWHERLHDLDGNVEVKAALGQLPPLECSDEEKATGKEQQVKD